MKHTLSKNDKQIIKYSPILKFVGLVIMLLGIAGVLIGIKKLYIIKISQTRNYDEILTLLSIGIICFAYLVFSAYHLIEKLRITSTPISEYNNQINPTGDNAGWFSFLAGCASGLFFSLCLTNG